MKAVQKRLGTENGPDEIDVDLVANTAVYVKLRLKEVLVNEIRVKSKIKRLNIEAKALLSVFRYPYGSEDVALSGVCEIQTHKRLRALLFVKKNVVNEELISGTMGFRWLTEDNTLYNEMILEKIDFYDSDGTLFSSRTP